MTSKSSLFADAVSSFEDSKFVIFGVPFDMTSTFRKGSRFAPRRIREASYNFESYLMDIEVDLTKARIHDAGDLVGLNNTESMSERVRMFAAKLKKAHKFPIAIGGEHSLTPAILESLDGVSVISLDAHLDFRDSYMNERRSHACSTRRMCEIVGARNVVPIGVRSLSIEEKEAAEQLGLNYVSSEEILAGKSIEEVLERACSNFGNEKYYLSLDMDVVDPAFAPGIANPEPFGLTPSHVKKCINSLSDRLVGFDVCEVCPVYDNGNTSALAATFIREVIGSVFSSSNVPR